MKKVLIAVALLAASSVASATSLYCVVGSVTHLNVNKMPTLVDQYPCVTRSASIATCKANIVSILASTVVQGTREYPASTWDTIPATVTSSLSCVETFL